MLDQNITTYQEKQFRAERVYFNSKKYNKISSFSFFHANETRIYMLQETLVTKNYEIFSTNTL